MKAKANCQLLVYSLMVQRVLLCVSVCVGVCVRVHFSCPCAAIKQLVNFSTLATRTSCQLPVASYQLPGVGCLRLLPPKIARVATPRGRLSALSRYCVFFSLFIV